MPRGVLLAAGLASQRDITSISETDLTACPRQIVLEREKDYLVNPMSFLYSLLRGHGAQNNALWAMNNPTAHKDLEALRTEALKNGLWGQKLSRTIKVSGRDIAVSATVYHYHHSPRPSMLEDFRSTLALRFVIEHGHKPEHEAQLNFAAYLLPDNLKPVEDIVIHYVTGTDIATTGTTYRQQGREKLIPPVRVWPAQEVEERLFPRLLLLDKCFKDGIKPPCDPGENRWRCQICPFSGAVKNQAYCIDMFADSQTDPEEDIIEESYGKGTDPAPKGDSQ